MWLHCTHMNPQIMHFSMGRYTRYTNCDFKEKFIIFKVSLETQHPYWVMFMPIWHAQQPIGLLCVKTTFENDKLLLEITINISSISTHTKMNDLRIHMGTMQQH